MAHQYYFSFDMITLLQPNTIFFPVWLTFFLFILVLFFFLLQHISKYTTVLLNKSIYKVNIPRV